MTDTGTDVDSKSDRADGTLRALANVGPAVERRFHALGILRVDDLVGRDPLELFAAMSELAGHPEDPCLLDTVMAAVEQAEGGPPRPWWDYTERRRHLLQGRS